MSTPLNLDGPELTDEVRKRLHNVLSNYCCQPTHEGWRRLALTLLSQQHSDFQPTKGQLSGAKHYGALLWMERLIRERPELKVTTAAKEVAKKINADKGREGSRVRPKTLQNQFAKLRARDSSECQLKSPDALQRFAAYWNALTNAAVQLEHTCTNEPFHDEGHPTRV